MSDRSPAGHRFRWWVFSAATAILVYQLMLPPVAGIGNNGDFSRTYGIFHLTMPIGDEARFADTRFQFDSRVNYFGGFYSSEILLVPPALALNSLISKDGSFDVRCMGLVQGCLFLAALGLFLPLLDDAPRGLQWMMSGLAVLLFSDVMYVAYLNSFYTDVAAYLFLLLATVLALRALRWNRSFDAALLAVASLLLVTSKAQHAVLGFWIAGLFCVLGWRGSHRKLYGAAAAVIAVTALLWLWKSTPEEYAARGLGLDPTYKPYIGMVSFSGGSPMENPRFVEEFHRRIGYGTLAWFLLTHPRDAYVALRVSLDEAGRQRPALGNFDPSAGLAPYAESQAFAAWSNLKRALFHRRGSRFLTCFLAISAGVAGLLLGQRRSLPAGAVTGGLILIGMAASELAVASLADAMDIPRHHLVFYAFFDLLLLTGAWLALRRSYRQ